jgi:aldehyde dehydrogenase (NAD+)
MVGDVLSGHPAVDAITFTGSTAVGRRIMGRAAETIKKVSLELGGKCPALVLEDADVRDIVPQAAGMVCFNAGQGCTLPTRMLVPRAHYEEAVELAREAFDAIPIGDPFDPATSIGPVNSARQFDRVMGYIEKGKEENRLVRGGGRHPDFDHGFFIEPTVFAEVKPDDTIAQQEIFGPVIAMMAYEDEADAIEIANNSIYGLSSVVWSPDPEHAMDVARKLRTGTVAINGTNYYGLELPFGGYRQSGLGRERGVPGFEEFLETKTVAWPRP